MRLLSICAALLLVLLAVPATVEAAPTCTPWVPSVDGRDKYCVDPSSTVCPVYQLHDGRWLDYKLCLIPWPYPGLTPVLP